MSVVSQAILAVTEIAVWVESFKKALTSTSPTTIVHALVQMGIDSPTGGCNCEMEWVERDAPETLWPWCHNHHRELNRQFWELIPKDLFPKLRRVLLADLKVESNIDAVEREAWKKFHDGSDDGFVCRPSGNIVTHDYAQAMLDHFLWADESKADWI
jgi:hypothetical protein